MTFRIFTAAACLAALASCGPSEGPDSASADMAEAPIGDASDDAAKQDRRDVQTEAGRGSVAVNCDTVSAEGFCGIAFGMSEAEARAGFEGELFGEPMAGSACFYLRTDEDAYGRAYMLVDGAVERIDIREEGVTTPEGASVGMAVDDVEALYDTTERTPNKYDPEKTVLKATLTHDAYAVFEEGDDGKVRAYRVGREPAVDYVEGCA